MDTETILICDDDMEKFIDKINYVEGNMEELSFIVDYVELTRCLQEIYQWYQIIKFNLSSLKTVSQSKNIIAVNSYVIGLLSPGKNLIDLMTLCMKNTYGDDSNEYKSFVTNYINKAYDESFSYRFLSRLRNFTQHCHIPISYQFNSFCFDMVQIYNTPHYNFNKKIKNEAEKLIEDIKISLKRNLTLALEPTISEYICFLYKNYKVFLELIRIELTEKQNVLSEFIDEHEELVQQTQSPSYNGWLFYYLTETSNILHAINTTEEPQELLSYWLNDAVDCYNVEKKNLKNMMSYMQQI